MMPYVPAGQAMPVVAPRADALVAIAARARVRRRRTRARAAIATRAPARGATTGMAWPAGTYGIIASPPSRPDRKSVV